MTNRREFLAHTALAGALLSMGGNQIAAAADKDIAPVAGARKEGALASKPLRILILGATGHIGPYHVAAALNRGHKVSAFTRGKTAPDLPSSVEILTGDRNSDLESIKNRDWDAVLDLATYGPGWVRSLGQATHGRVKHYTFISSEAVYDKPISNANGTDEESKVLEYRETADPYAAKLPEDQYGQLKVLCEREAEKQFPGKTLIIRSASIIGPGDFVGAFTYLPVRMEAGGEMLVAGDPLSPIQMIDVRDLAEWIIRMVEVGGTGTFNTVGPALPMGWAEMLGAVRSVSSVPLKLTWVPTAWLAEQQVTSWSNVLFWPTEVGTPGLMRTSNDKARAKGLTFRSVSVSAADTLAWFKSQPIERQKQLLMGFNGNTGLEESMEREHALLAAWHAHQAKG